MASKEQNERYEILVAALTHEGAANPAVRQLLDAETGVTKEQHKKLLEWHDRIAAGDAEAHEELMGEAQAMGKQLRPDV